eukprot:18390-Heterococcus_DN1.PRE.2
MQGSEAQCQLALAAAAAVLPLLLLTVIGQQSTAVAARVYAETLMYDEQLCLGGAMICQYSSSSCCSAAENRRKYQRTTRHIYRWHTRAATACTMCSIGHSINSKLYTVDACVTNTTACYHELCRRNTRCSHAAINCKLASRTKLDCSSRVIQAQFRGSVLLCTAVITLCRFSRCTETASNCVLLLLQLCFADHITATSQ